MGCSLRSERRANGILEPDEGIPLRIDAIPGYWPGKHDPEYYENKWRGMYQLPKAIRDRFHREMEIRLCFPVLDLDRRREKIAAVEEIEESFYLYE